MPRAALYHRVSTLDQHPELARAELRAAAAARGLEVTLDVEETGSGARNDRPGLQRVLEAARRHRVDVVLVWKLDRFGRSAADVLTNVRELEQRGVSFEAVSQGLALRAGGDAVSRLLLTMLAAVAEFELDLIRDRTRLGLARARAAGRQLGRPRGPRAPSPATVLRLRAAGYTWLGIALELGCTIGAARRALPKTG
jgi:putative DNA-invertase from lambdoid prophage Rac